MILGSLAGAPVWAYAAVGGLALAMGAFVIGFQYGTGKSEAQDLEILEDVEGAEGFRMTSYDRGRKPGIVSTWLRERKRKKALSRGMVRWHVVGSAFEEPRYVKPTRKEGGNVPELELDGDTYYFPTEASVPAEDEGVPTVVHRKGEADPIELRDGWEHSVDASTLAEYLTLRVTSRKPSSGLLDGLTGDYDSMDLLRYGILGIVVLAIGWEVLG